ncbi:MAG: ADP-ribosylglycohydrolase family protein [Armatimonadetes bacterium]|nr:ADP-ribosylglycohydrolase family protein [Armatimonadota bacterium]
MTRPMDEIRDRCKAAWIGAAMGGSLAAATDGEEDIQPLPEPASPMVAAHASACVDAMRLSLRALEAARGALSPAALAEARLEGLTYRWDAFGAARSNLLRGLRPPASGHFWNPCANGVAAAGRAALWGMVAPGAPQTAAWLARRDAGIDHAGQGVEAAGAAAMMVSLAMIGADPLSCIRFAIDALTPASRVRLGLRLGLAAGPAEGSLATARGALLQGMGDADLADAGINLGFVALGLSRPGGPAAQLATVVALARAAMPNGVLAGALLGASLGTAGLPAEWVASLGAALPVGWGLRSDGDGHSPDALAERCVAVAAVPPAPSARGGAEAAGGSEVTAVAAADPEPVAVVVPDIADAPPPEAGPDADAGVDPAAEAPAADDAVPPAEVIAPPVVAAPPIVAAPTLVAMPALDPGFAATHPEELGTASIYRAGEFEIAADFGERGPALYPGVPATLMLEVRNQSALRFIGSISLTAPAGWEVHVPGAQGARQDLPPGRAARLGFVVRAPATAAMPPVNTLTVTLTPDEGEARVCTVAAPAGACWWAVGALPSPLREGYEKRYEVEDKQGLEETYLSRAGGLVGWTRLQVPGSELPLEEAYFKGAPGVAYARLVLRVPAAVETRLVVHTNDGAKVWVAGRLVFQVHSHQACRPTWSGGPGASLKLPAGDTPLLVKAVRCDEPYRLALMFLGPDGDPLISLSTAHW